MRTIWLAEIPDIFGYGLCVMAETEAEAMDALRAEHRKWKKDFSGERSFAEALEYFGGGAREIELGKVYNDGFKE